MEQDTSERKKEKETMKNKEQKELKRLIVLEKEPTQEVIKALEEIPALTLEQIAKGKYKADKYDKLIKFLKKEIMK